MDFSSDGALLTVTVTVKVTGNLLNTKELTLVSRQLATGTGQPQGMEPRAMEPRAMEPRAMEPRAMEPSIA
jgi:hypothetical protein